MGSAREGDLRLLNELLDDHVHELSETEAEAFTDMRCDLVGYDSGDGFRELTGPRQSWVKKVHDRIVPQYENLMSRGLVPRGREVPTPKVLQNLPTRPPTRRPPSDEE